MHQDLVISYFEEKEEKLSKVLDIFVRVNSGGVVLTTAANMKVLDERWDEVEKALRIGVKLLSSFGFSEGSLPAASVLIPLADYIHLRGLDESYSLPPSHRSGLTAPLCATGRSGRSSSRESGAAPSTACCERCIRR